MTTLAWALTLIVLLPLAPAIRSRRPVSSIPGVRLVS
jgi:hypothetical protein